MTEYLTQSSKGIVNVTIDDVEIKKMMDRSQFNGGTSSLPLSTTQVRSKLRDPANMGNGEFTSNMVASGTLSPQFSQTSAPAVNRTVGKSPTPVRGSTPVGRGGNRESQGVFQPAPAVGNRQFVPAVKYFITSKSTINPGTLLADGVPLSTFTAGEGDRSNINHVTSTANRQQLARNLQLQAQILLYVNSGRRSKFADYTLKVIEGIYKPGPQETSTAGSLNELAAQGRSVVYELINNSTGKVNAAKTFELATSLKSIALYDKLILDYDHFNPDGSMNVQLIVVTPNVSEKYAASYKFELETRYNNNVQSAELVEVLGKPASTTPNTSSSGTSGSTTSSPSTVGTTSSSAGAGVTVTNSSGPAPEPTAADVQAEIDAARADIASIRATGTVAAPTRAQLRAEQLGLGVLSPEAAAAAVGPNYNTTFPAGATSGTQSK